MLKYLFQWPVWWWRGRRELWDRRGRRAETRGVCVCEMRLGFHRYQGTAAGKTALVSVREYVRGERSCVCVCVCMTQRERERRLSWDRRRVYVCVNECVLTLQVKSKMMKAWATPGYRRDRGEFRDGDDADIFCLNHVCHFCSYFTCPV